MKNSHFKVGTRLLLGVFLSIAGTSSLVSAQSLVPNGDFAAPLAGNWFAGGKGGSEPKVIPVQIEAAKDVTRALQLTLSPAAEAKPWDYRLSAPKSPLAINAGDMIGVAFWARSAAPTQFNVVYQQAKEPYDKSIRQTVSTTPQWLRVILFGNAKSAYGAGESNFELQLGLASGTVELADIRVGNLGAATKEEAFTKLTGLPPAALPAAVAVPAPASPRPVPEAKPRTTPAYVILKLDDLVVSGASVNVRWKKAVDFIKQRNVKCTIGIITNSLEADNKPEYFKWIKEQQATGLFEFWCHGYDHKSWKEGDVELQEFKGTPLEAQKKSLARSNELAQQKLGFTFSTFGSPFNGMDDNTVQAMAEDPNFKIWLYGDSKRPGGKFVMDRIGDVNIENPLFVPSLERFVTGWNRRLTQPYFVVQGHPQQWDDARFDQFTKIVDFCIEQKAILTTPSEYSKLVGK